MANFHTSTIYVRRRKPFGDLQFFLFWSSNFWSSSGPPDDGHLSGSHWDRNYFFLEPLLHGQLFAEITFHNRGKFWLYFTTSSLKITFYLKGMFFKVAPKVKIYLGNFSEKICHQKVSKIAQSGRIASEMPQTFSWRQIRSSDIFVFYFMTSKDILLLTGERLFF